MPLTTDSNALNTLPLADSTHIYHRMQVRGARDGGIPAEIFAIEDNYTDPWIAADTIVMLHGIAEQAEVWAPWVPHLARRHRILRLDLRGFGRSSAMPPGFALADWADDVEQLINALDRTRVHLVGAKLGALISFELAQRCPAWLRSMTIAGMLPSPRKALAQWCDDWLAIVEGSENGVERWAEKTMPGRMGNSLSPEAMHWWTKLMGAAPRSSVAACFRLLPGIDGPTNPERVECPTLFITAGAPRTASAPTYDQRPSASDLQQLRDRLRRAELIEIPADSYHIAATHPDHCARETFAFLERVNSLASGTNDEAPQLQHD